MVYNNMILILLDATDTPYKLQDIIDNDDEMDIMWDSDINKTTKCLEDCIYILQDMLYKRKEDSNRY